MLDFSVREVLSKKALRVAVLRPLKIVIENCPEGQVEELLLDAVIRRSGGRVAQDKIRARSFTSSRTTSWGKFRPEKFFRLSPGTSALALCLFRYVSRSR